LSRPGPDAAEPLIDHALGLRWADLPEVTRAAARTFLHDSLCVGAAGARAVHANEVLAIARSWGAGDQASVLGRADLRLPAASAAFVNAFQIHGQEYDCVHEPAVLHPMATVAAAVLAEAQRGAAVSGEQLLRAIVAGVDIAVTLGLAARGPLTFFRPATAGIFGSVAAIAALRTMPRDQALDAFGHALAFASGTMQAHVEGKPALPVQVANAARGALVAIDLARAGMPGVAGPVEGPFGYLTLLETTSDLAAALARLGQGHRIEEVSWKPFPTGRAAQGGIVAIQELLAQGVLVADIVALEYHAPPLIHRLVGRPARARMEPGYARLCLAWLAAVTLMRGTVALDDFQPGPLADPALHKLAARVSVIADANPDPAAFVPARLVARLADGRTIDIAVDALFGAPNRPLTPAQHRAKARGCLAFAGLDQCDDALAAAIDGLNSERDAVAALVATGIMA
jgi:2-methylcitrate dehydratase PrpD